MVYQPVDAVANPKLQIDPPLKELSSRPDVLLQGRQRETSTHTIPGLGTFGPEFNSFNFLRFSA